MLLQFIIIYLLRALTKTMQVLTLERSPRRRQRAARSRAPPCYRRPDRARQLQAPPACRPIPENFCVRPPYGQTAHRSYAAGEVPRLQLDAGCLIFSQKIVNLADPTALASGSILYKVDQGRMPLSALPAQELSAPTFD